MAPESKLLTKILEAIKEGECLDPQENCKHGQEVVRDIVVILDCNLVCDKETSGEAKAKRHQEHRIRNDVDPVPDASEEKGGTALKDLLEQARAARQHEQNGTIGVVLDCDNARMGMFFERNRSLGLGANLTRRDSSKM